MLTFDGEPGFPYGEPGVPSGSQEYPSTDAAHDHVFRSLKGEVERIVAERSRDQVKI